MSNYQILRNQLSKLRETLNQTLNVVDMVQNSGDFSEKDTRLESRRLAILDMLERHEWVGFDDWIDAEKISDAPNPPEYWIKIVYTDEEAVDENGILKLEETGRFQLDTKNMVLTEIDGIKDIYINEYQESPSFFEACFGYYPKLIMRAW